MEKKKVLIIDDSKMVLMVASKALENAGYDVRSVLYPDEVNGTLMNEVFEYTPDLILSDVDMPTVTGDVFAKIAKASPLTRKLKLFFYSSQPEAKLRKCIEDSNADGFIPKTKDITLLVSRVREIIG